MRSNAITPLHLLLSLALGAVLGAALVHRAPWVVPGDPAESCRGLQATLYRFKVKDGEDDSYRAWMTMLNQRHNEAVDSLGRENTMVEAIFRDAESDPRSLYWLVVKTPGGALVETSALPIDKVHNAFMEKVLVKGSRVTLTRDNYLLNPALACSA